MNSLCPLVGISCDQAHTASTERINTSQHAHDLKEKCSAVPVLRGHSQDESDEAADENGKYEAPDNEEQSAPDGYLKRTFENICKAEVLKRVGAANTSSTGPKFYLVPHSPNRIGYLT